MIYTFIKSNFNIIPNDNTSLEFTYFKVLLFIITWIHRIFPYDCIYCNGCYGWTIFCWTWWRHQMDTFSMLLALCEGGIHRPPVDSSHKDQWRGALMFYLICAWTNSWANNQDAGDLRRHGVHNDVIVMMLVWHEFRVVYPTFKQPPD